MLDQMRTDVAHSINDAICSPNKDLYGWINSFQMQELLAHSHVKTDVQDEILIQKFQKSVFRNVRRHCHLWAYGILQEVFQMQFLKFWKRMKFYEVSELRKQLVDIKNSQASFAAYPRHKSQEKDLANFRTKFPRN